MEIHLISVEIGVVRVTIGIVHMNRPFFAQDADFMGHHTRLVESRLAIDEEVITCNTLKDLEEIGYTGDTMTMNLLHSEDLVISLGFLQHLRDGHS